MREQHFIEPILRKYMNGTCSKEEFQQFKDFLKQPGATEIIDQLINEELGEQVQNLKSESKQSRILFENIKERVGQYENDHLVTLFKEHKKKSKGGAFQWLKAAAVLLIVSVSAWGLWHFNQTTTTRNMSWLEKRTQRGQKTTITLMDGSTVVLNADSKLKFPEQFGETREVLLEGEAFFMVAKNDKPFIIRTGEIVTQVLGTSFNIRAYPEADIEVTVATGKVSVAKLQLFTPTQSEEDASKALPNREEVLLTPSQQATYHITTGSIVKQQVETEQIFAWRDGMLMFTSTKFKDVVTTLERWYGAEIVLENEDLGNCVVTFKSKNESLENVLKALQFIIDIQYEFTKEEVILRGKAC